MRHFKCYEPPRVLHEELSTGHLTKKKKNSVENNITVVAFQLSREQINCSPH